MPVSNNMHVVFLQGMPSPFFSRIAAKLSELGCKTTGMNFCAGDALFWKGARTAHYRGTLSDWPGFFETWILQQQVTDVVLLGEQRDYHKQAVGIAKRHHIRVTVTDFGYLRPDWITLERDGMSSNSKFPKTAEAISALAESVTPADMTTQYHDNSRTMAVNDLLYSFSNVVFWWLYPHYRRSDRRPHPIKYFPSIGWRLLFTKKRHKEAGIRIETLLASNVPYYIFPLQLEHDFQLVAYSPFDRMEDAIRLIITSFSCHAPRDSRLIIKAHPWDPGFTNWGKKISQIARVVGVDGRVDYVDGGNLTHMIQGASAMVTINSTSGIQALQSGCPVITLGDAIYNIRGLTRQNGLDNFWSETELPDAKLVNDFIQAMAGTIQIRGVFFSEPGLGVAVAEAASRIYDQTVGQPKKLQ